MNAKKRMLSTLLAFLFIWQFVPCNVSASDDASTPSSETVKRVQQEALSGNITNVDDVLVEVFVESTSFVIWNNLRMDLDWTTVPGWERGW